MPLKQLKQALTIAIITTFFISCQFGGQRNDIGTASVTVANLVEIKELPGYDSYGFIKDGSEVKEHKVKKNESLYVILRSLDVSPQTIYDLQEQSKGKFQANRIRQNQKYYTYLDADTKKAQRLVFHNSAVDYVIFDWLDGVSVTTGSKELRKEEVAAYGTIKTSLYEALVEQGVNILVANRLSEIFGWQIDFFRLYPGDGFKVIYEKQYVEDKEYGIGDVLAAEFIHQGETYGAFLYEDADRLGYFDEDGNSVQKALLKAPFKYSHRVSSGFSLNRFHPVLKESRPHYGVDYAAPLGTPVIAVGDGEVIEARYRGANGNIVKIRHNSTYTTAYLHLNGFAKGIKKGTRVKQSQVIGYVGRTGRVTGVHLDYRVYKNDRPVNPLKIKLPPADGISEKDLDVYKLRISTLKQSLDALTDTEEVIAGLN
ncbi:MAG: peptidoglycan DD-metalloendopeptidase family protein [Balneolaceae bacterium]